MSLLDLQTVPVVEPIRAVEDGPKREVVMVGDREGWHIEARLVTGKRRMEIHVLDRIKPFITCFGTEIKAH